jgi:membrane protein YqaA with SNARE-associated domain
MWLDLAIFLVLAMACNTVLPMPFDPVLIYFASRHTRIDEVVFAIAGSICAGVSGAGEAKVLGILNRNIPEKWTQTLSPNWRGHRFYALTFLFALLPLPFSVVRLAVLRRQPRILPYGLAIVLGRLPRYVLTIVLWRGFGLPNWLNAVILLAAIALSACLGSDPSSPVCRRVRGRGVRP